MWFLGQTFYNLEDGFKRYFKIIVELFTSSPNYYHMQHIMFG